jgi:WS/DGAT/MGAT family acyltransferase
METVPLGAEDRAILALESETVAGHTCKVVRVGPGAPDVERLRASVAARLADAPALTRRLGGKPSAPEWVPDPDFDVADHVVAAPIVEPLDATDLRAAVAELFTERLDRSRPLWRIDVLPVADGGSALVWRIHHALADGTAAMRHARTMLWDPAEPLPDAAGARPATDRATAAHAGSSAAARARSAAAADAEDERRRRAHLAAFIKREAPHPHSHSPFGGRIGPRREVEFARASLPNLHDAAKRLDGATVNDGVLTVIAGALRGWAEQRHGHLGAVRVKVPVSLHHEGDDDGNRDSFFTLALPIGEPDAVERLRAVHAATTACKAGHDAELMDELGRELEHASPRLRSLLTHIEDGPAAFALSVSNVPGPRTPVTVLGAPVEALHSIAEIGERHALRVAVVSLADELYFGFCADPAIVSDLSLLAAGVESEAATLIAAA